jgi:hypothetical protein
LCQNEGRGGKVKECRSRKSIVKEVELQMSKLLNPKVSDNFQKYQHAGALKAIHFDCELKETTSGKERFVPRAIDTRKKIYFSDKNSCL